MIERGEFKTTLMINNNLIYVYYYVTIVGRVILARLMIITGSLVHILVWFKVNLSISKHS